MKSLVKAIVSILPPTILSFLVSYYRIMRGHRSSRTKTRLIEYCGGLYLAFNGNFTDDLLTSTGAYERNLQRIMKAIIRKDWTVIDIGANVGIHTVLMANEARDGHTYAFEPVIYNYHKLNTNVVLSGLNNISIYSYAVGQAAGNLNLKTIKQSRPEHGSSSLVENEHLAALGDDAYDEVAVEVVALDDFVKQKNLKVDFIKMDIEGFEYWALLGMIDTINTQHPVMIIEYNVSRLDFLQLSNKDMESILGENYDCYEISKFDHVEKYSLDPFHFDRHVETDLLCIPKPKFLNS